MHVICSYLDLDWLSSVELHPGENDIYQYRYCRSLGPRCFTLLLISSYISTQPSEHDVATLVVLPKSRLGSCAVPIRQVLAC